MDHLTAKSANLLEQYLLGEMAEAERSAFEEHYFSCAECADEVVTATKFLDNARRPLLRLAAEAPVAAAVPEARWWERWLMPIPKPALAGLCACMALALLWQNVPGEAEAEVAGSYFVTSTRAAGGAPRRIQVARGQKRVALMFNYTDTSVTQFAMRLENAEGQVVRTFEGKAPQDTNDIEILLPVARLRSGIYTLRVQNAATQKDIGALPFELALP